MHNAARVGLVILVFLAATAACNPGPSPQMGVVLPDISGAGDLSVAEGEVWRIEQAGIRGGVRVANGDLLAVAAGARQGRQGEQQEQGGGMAA